MIVRFPAFLLVLGLACVPSLADSMSPDELAVRAVYSAIVLRSRMASLRSTYYSDHFSTEPQLAVQLSDFQAGPIADIASTPLSKLVTTPTGEVLSVTPGSYSLNSRFVGNLLEVGDWVPANTQFNSNAISDLAVLTTSQIGLAGPKSPNDRYLAFSVSLSAHGKQRSYKALALFQERGSRVRTVDYILGQPELLIGTNIVEQFNELPVTLFNADKTKLKEFINSVTMTGSCAKDSNTELCCDSVSKLCGLPPRTLQR